MNAFQILRVHLLIIVIYTIDHDDMRGNKSKEPSVSNRIELQ